MDARITVSGREDAFSSLWEWLMDEDELRGTVRAVRKPFGKTDLGGAVDALAVAVGASGAGTALARSLSTWLQARRTHATITVEIAEVKVTLDIDSVHDVAPLLQQVLNVADEP